MRMRSAPSARWRRDGHSISVKLSALHPRYEVAQYERCVPAADRAGRGAGDCSPRRSRHRLHHRRRGERAARDEPRHHRGGRRPAGARRAGTGSAWRSRPMASAPGRPSPGPMRSARRPAGGSRSRLVKGAYWDSEIKRTQEQGLADYPLFTRKAATDVSYLACARDMLAAKNIFPAFATHNALTVATILEWAGDSRDFEFQRLHGMGEGLYEKPGPRAGLSYPHLRAGRRASRSARLSGPPPAREWRQFQLRPPARRRDAVSDADLLADPVAKIAAVGGTRHPVHPAAARSVPAGARE